MNQFSSANVVGTGDLSSTLALRVGATMVNMVIGWHDAEMVKNTVNTIMLKLRAREIVGTASQQAVKGANFIVSAVLGHARTVSDLSSVNSAARRAQSDPR